MKLLLIIISGFLALSQPAYANVYKSVTEENFQEGIYRSFFKLNGAIDGRQEVQHCAEDASFLLNEANLNHIKIQRFECVMSEHSGYEILLFAK